MSFLEKKLPNSKEKNLDELLFGKVVGLQHRNLLSGTRQLMFSLELLTPYFNAFSRIVIT